MLRDDWTRFFYAMGIYSNKKVKKLDFNVIMEDTTGTLSMTDFQLQDGDNVTTNVPNTSEMLEGVKFGVQEDYFLTTVKNPYKPGAQPFNWTECENRFFNIVGRGHEVVSIPNVFHEDYKQELVSSALDIRLRPKEDYDLIRISTNDGGLVEGRMYEEIPDHPLNYMYTREFFFEGGKAHEEVRLDTEIFRASKNGQYVPLHAGKVPMNGKPFMYTRQRFMLAPFGSFRLRIEFYKLVTKTVTNPYGESKTMEVYDDVGIGYYGVAEFRQYKARAKI